MTAEKLDGRQVASTIRAELRDRVSALTVGGIVPGLGTVLVGEDPGSVSYVAGKHRDCAEVGITGIRRELPETVTQAELEAVLDDLNQDPTCTGYIVQLPLPPHLDTPRALELIDPAKDADGLHPVNLGKLVLGEAAVLPCTPRGIVELLDRHGLSWEGADVCILGRGVTVGRPLSLILTRRAQNATVTVCHTGTRDVEHHLRTADIVIAAVGSAHFVTPELVKPGAIVIDVGISRTEAGLVGDVHPDVTEVAAWVAPMPGGTGPMTRAMLLQNVVEAAERQAMEHR